MNCSLNTKLMIIEQMRTDLVKKVESLKSDIMDTLFDYIKNSGFSVKIKRIWHSESALFCAEIIMLGHGMYADVVLDCGTRCTILGKVHDIVDDVYKLMIEDTSRTCSDSIMCVLQSRIINTIIIRER